MMYNTTTGRKNTKDMDYNKKNGCEGDQETSGGVVKCPLFSQVIYIRENILNETRLCNHIETVKVIKKLPTYPFLNPTFCPK